MMPGDVLTEDSTIQCPHGGVAALSTANTKVKVGGAFALLESDIFTVSGCPFTIGPKYSPCTRIEWSAGAVKVRADTAVLVSSSIGVCYSGESLPQGLAIIANTQSKLSAQ
jgi:hypothetical protein